METNQLATTVSKKKRWLSVILGAVILLSLVVVAIEYSGGRSPHALPDRVEHNRLNLDLSHPDVLIESVSLSQLPKDLLTVPLLRDTLTEDFVFYYQHNADRMGLLGSLRRIVYEHKLEFQDSLLESLLDQPASVALWHDKRGRLQHFMVVISRNGLARLLEPLLFAATDDSQLSRTELTQLKVNNSEAPIYQLRYNGKKSLLFASHADQLLILSSADLLFNGDKQASEATEIAEAALSGSAPWAKSFGLSPRSDPSAPQQSAPSHRIAVSANYLGLGYQRLMPAFAGVRFEMAPQSGWQGFLALNDRQISNDTTFDFLPIWQTLPTGASACITLPVAQGSAEEILQRVGSEKTVAVSLAQRMTGAAGLCWYAESRLFTPLLVSQIQGPLSTEEEQALGQLFSSTVGAYEKKAPQGKLPLEEEKSARWHRWQREISSSYGQYTAEHASHPEQLNAARFFRVTLVQDSNTLLFSLDDQLVTRAQQVIGKTYPAMVEHLPKDRITPFYLDPKSLSQLMLQETFDSLPQNEEPIFFNAARTLLVPKLNALAEHPPYVLTLPAQVEARAAWQWIPLQWQPL